VRGNLGATQTGSGVVVVVVVVVVGEKNEGLNEIPC